MTPRITLEKVVFASPFKLAALAAVLPSGTFTIETIEEPIGGMMGTGWRRTSTTIEVHTGGMIQRHPIEPEELAANRQKPLAE